VTGLRLDVQWLPSVGSTMDIVQQAAERGAPEGLVVVADEQTSGRGRRGRVWSSPPGAGRYVSFLFRPPIHPAESAALGLLTLAAGVAVRAAIGHASGLHPTLKWPNDVMIGRRKLAGILAEGLSVGSPAQAVVLGIGINLLAASHPGEVADRATSLESELGRAVDRALVLEELLVQVAEHYAHLVHGNVSQVLCEWRAAAPSAHGARVQWTASDGVRRGTAAGIDDTGALLVRTHAGVERIIGGEVQWDLG
jgi:BirA family biotin operon repressor/biotin-[acetyl-CoA-carboxylase] ligase